MFTIQLSCIACLRVRKLECSGSGRESKQKKVSGHRRQLQMYVKDLEKGKTLVQNGKLKTDIMFSVTYLFEARLQKHQREAELMVVNSFECYAT